jgi:nucleoside-diphosphate-sugar epimerase
MHIAVAGAGALARYIGDEFPKHGHEVVILTRSEKEFFRNRRHMTQVVTDYTVPSLVTAIEDCEMLISVIELSTTDNIDVHLNLMKACQLSPKCKRFIPCEYGANIEDHPDVPFFHWETREPIRKALREQTEIEWTLVNIGWLVDYVVPRRNRYLKEPGETFPVNVEEKRLVIPGTGKESVDVTAARDVAAALALLAKAPSWEPYTYISGKKTCWNELAELVQRRYPGTWDVRRLGLGRILETIQISTDKREVIIAHYQLITPLGAGDFHALKVEDHRRKFFPELVFRSPEQLIDEIEESWNKIV